MERISEPVCSGHVLAWVQSDHWDSRPKPLREARIHKEPFDWIQIEGLEETGLQLPACGIPPERKKHHGCRRGNTPESQETKPKN